MDDLEALARRSADRKVQRLHTRHYVTRPDAKSSTSRSSQRRNASTSSRTKGPRPGRLTRRVHVRRDGGRARRGTPRHVGVEAVEDRLRRRATRLVVDPAQLRSARGLLHGRQVEDVQPPDAHPCPSRASCRRCASRRATARGTPRSRAASRALRPPTLPSISQVPPAGSPASRRSGRCPGERRCPSSCGRRPSTSLPSLVTVEVLEIRRARLPLAHVDDVRVSVEERPPVFGVRVAGSRTPWSRRAPVGDTRARLEDPLRERLLVQHMR